ncbi:MAG: hypothetical protein FJ386_13825, partial [Verrucomicrobia bacterium]|nr:hypothetical protein [Verrucomicrobiota bacterium]
MKTLTSLTPAGALCAALAPASLQAQDRKQPQQPGNFRGADRTMRAGGTLVPALLCLALSGTALAQQPRATERRDAIRVERIASKYAAAPQ